MALEVGEGRAAVASQGTDEAVKLCIVSKDSELTPHGTGETYSACRDVFKLSRGNRGQGNDGGDGEALHYGGCFDVDELV